MIDGKFCVRKAFSDIQRVPTNLADKNTNKSKKDYNNNRRIVDLKTGKTRKEEEYEKTVRLLRLIKFS